MIFITGTVDIACHEIMDEFAVKEILSPSGGPWGSCWIDDQYIKLLEDIFSKEWVEGYKNEEPGKYVEMLNKFQTAKEKFYDDEKMEHCDCELVGGFMNFVLEKIKTSNKKNRTIQGIVSGETNGDVTYNNSKVLFKIGIKTWKALFDHVVNPIIDHVKELLKTPKLMGNCKYLCMVGGLSCSPYFQHRMKTEFGPRSTHKLQIIIPESPILSVVKGAAYFGLLLKKKHDYIQGRVLQRSYGYIVTKTQSAVKFAMDNIIRTNDFEIKKLIKQMQITGMRRNKAGARDKSNADLDTLQRKIAALKKNNEDLKSHIKRNRYYDKYRQKYYIKNCFEILASKNEQILFGINKQGTAKRDSSTTKEQRIQIYCSDKENPLFKSDGRLLGDLELKWEDHEKDMEIIIDFTFAKSFIRASIYKSSQPNSKVTLDINYHNNWEMNEEENIEQRWICLACTFQNDMEMPICELCHTKKPKRPSIAIVTIQPTFKNKFKNTFIKVHCISLSFVKFVLFLYYFDSNHRIKSEENGKCR